MLGEVILMLAAPSPCLSVSGVFSLAFLEVSSLATLLEVVLAAAASPA